MKESYAVSVFACVDWVLCVWGNVGCVWRERGVTETTFVVETLVGCDDDVVGHRIRGCV